MKEFDFPIEIVSPLIFTLLPGKSDLKLVLDRTNWNFGTKNIYNLMLRINYINIAFSLIFKMLDKQRNSDTQTRIDLIKTYIEWFGKASVNCLLAVREFVEEKWLTFLSQNNIRYHIIIRNNFKFILVKNRKRLMLFSCSII